MNDETAMTNSEGGRQPARTAGDSDLVIAV
jgi:hypothetical protein